MTDITIYHNPACGTSRNTLALIRNSGAEPTVILYLETPPSRDELKKLIADMGIGVRDLLRKNTEPYEQLGLAEDRFSNDELLDAMLAHPILINRPVVVTPLGTKLCRPSEVVLDILPDPQQGAFTKEDGEASLMSTGTASATDFLPGCGHNSVEKAGICRLFYMLRWLTRSESCAALSFLSL